MSSKYQKQGVSNFISSCFSLATNGMLVQNFMLVIGVYVILGGALFLLIGNMQRFIEVASNPGAAVGLYIAIQLASMFATGFLTCAIVHSQSEYYQGSDVSFGESISKGFSKLLSWIGCIVVVFLVFFGVGIAIGLIIAALQFVLPQRIAPEVVTFASVVFGIICFYYSLGLVILAPAMIVEDLGPVASVTRSFSLSKGFRGRIFWRMLVFMLALIGVIMVLGLIFGLAMQALITIPYGPILTAIPFGAVYLYLFLVFSAFTSVMYFDLRATKESFGLDQLAENFD